MKAYKILIICLLPLSYSVNLSAQDNYEIQVYSSAVVERKNTMVEIHSNYSLGESDPDQNSSSQILHETLEITHGFSKWFEIGGYIFTSISSEQSGFAGVHIRPRFAIPQEYELPIGISLSSEVGYQKADFFGSRWVAEVRPIFDKKINSFYCSANLTLDMSLDKSQNNALEFNPSLKTSYSVSRKVDLGLEYYSGLGFINDFEPIQNQSHTIFAAIDWDFHPDWEFNAGVGYGLTSSSDNLVVKLILGYRLPF